MGKIKNFAIFEGLDGSGTSTQMRRLEQRMAGREDFVSTFEPTDGFLGSLLRKALRGDIALLPETLALLFAADRNEHLYGPGGIVEATKGGKLLVCDRYVPSSLVYQGISAGEETARSLNRSFPLPEMMIYFDLDPEISGKRMEERKSRDIYENFAFQMKVRKAYEKILPGYENAGCRVIRIDASQTPDIVEENVWKALQSMDFFSKEAGK